MKRVATQCCLLAVTTLAPTWGVGATPSSGCGKTLASGVYQMTDQNVTRTYRVFLPSGYQPSIAYPMVMVFHGWGGDEEVESKLCVDTARVFASGGSNGGMFAWELGQNTGSAPIFRAIASLIGLPHRGYVDSPGKAGGMPVLVITGTHDRTVPPGAWESTADPRFL
jgi:poly(3-hydroxybutyrate) depolymerase